MNSELIKLLVGLQTQVVTCKHFVRVTDAPTLHKVLNDAAAIMMEAHDELLRLDGENGTARIRAAFAPLLDNVKSAKKASE